MSRNPGWDVPRICRLDGCGKSFVPAHPTQRYCGRPCRLAADRQQHHRRPDIIPGIPKGTTGAMSEMAAAIDLMKRGYEVFRALSPHCSCDLIALGPDGALRIEVRTGYRSPVSGILQFARNGPARRGHSEEKLDHYAVVIGYGQEIAYVPPLVEETRRAREIGTGALAG